MIIATTEALLYKLEHIVLVTNSNFCTVKDLDLFNVLKKNLHLTIGKQIHKVDFRRM